MLILTAADSVEERVKGLDYGADDYMAKPFSLQELEARVRALTRRGMGGTSSTIKHGPLVYDQAGRVATIDGKMVELSARELGLLEVLLQRAGRLVSKDQLVERLCEWGEEVSNNAIEVYIHRLRKKIEKGPIRIATVRGLGYCLEKILSSPRGSIASHPQRASPLRRVKIFQREQRSLFGEILDWMLTPLLLLWPVSLALTWLVAQSIAGKPFDRALEYNVQALAQLVSGADGRRGVQPAAAGARDAARRRFRPRLLPGAGRAAATCSAASATCRSRPRTSRPCRRGRLRDDEMRGLDVRVAYTWVSRTRRARQPVLVQVAETREKRSVLATEIIKGVMLPQFVILPLAVLLVWLALVRGIKPLSQLEERIRARKPDDLSPLDDKAVPLEVAPLVSSVNDLLTRLKDSIATQKRFLADAAHQLKTPLAGLRMQADLAQREGANAEELKQSLKQIGRASMRATHTVNQLLALARAESSGASIGPPALRPGAPHHRSGAGGRAARDRQAHRPGLRRRRSRARRACVLRRQPHAAQGDGPQPAGQRDQLHAVERRAARA